MCLGVRSKGGSLDKDEFGGIFEEIQMPLTKTELDGVFADIDKDGGGDVRTASPSQRCSARPRALTRGALPADRLRRILSMDDGHAPQGRCAAA